jgi:hypothetical protein
LRFFKVFFLLFSQSPSEIGVEKPQTRKREDTEDALASKKAHIDASPSEALNPSATVLKPLVQPSLNSSGNRGNKRRPVASDFFDLPPGNESLYKSNKEAALEFEIKMKAEIMEYEANKANEEALLKARIEQERLEKQPLEEAKLANEEKAKQEAVLKAEAEKKAQEEAVLKAQIEVKKATEAERVAKEQQAQQERVSKMKAAHVAAVQRIRKEREEKAKRKQARQEKLRLQEEAYQRKMEVKIQEQKEIIGGLFDDH